MKAGAVLHRLQNLPFAELAVITGGGSPLILAPHPDDESLGCGGFLAAASAARARPAVVFVTDGSASHPGSGRFNARARAEVRVAEAQEATRLLGVAPDRVIFLGLPDSQAPHEGSGFARAVERIAAFAGQCGCRSVLAPWAHDPHGDHVAVHRMAAALAGDGLRHWSYVVWGWTLDAEAWLPDELPDGVRLAIGPFMKVKGRAIAAHRSQHGHVFTDDPAGFVLCPEFLGYFERPWEVFLGETQALPSLELAGDDARPERRADDEGRSRSSCRPLPLLQGRGDCEGLG